MSEDDGQVPIEEVVLDMPHLVVRGAEVLVPQLCTLLHSASSAGVTNGLIMHIFHLLYPVTHGPIIHNFN